MRRIRWAPAAADDLEQIRNYQQEHHPSRALSTVSTLYEAARSLKQFPYRGRNGDVEGTRELVMASRHTNPPAAPKDVAPIPFMDVMTLPSVSAAYLDPAALRPCGNPLCSR